MAKDNIYLSRCRMRLAIERMNLAVNHITGRKKYRPFYYIDSLLAGLAKMLKSC